jgi:glycolate oxidase FAD binding subunit
MQVLKPGTAAEAAEVIADSAAAGTRLEIRGGGSKAEIGAPREAVILDMSAFSSVIDYDPPELVLTVGPGASLAMVEALVASEGQQLAFEPFDHGPIFGRPAGAATIGGVIAAGVSGSRRVSAGGVRDHLLGFHAVSGRGEAVVGGAKVVKNVTGYDLPKLACGSWGRLFALTEVTLKVLPRGRDRATLAARGLTPAAAQGAMARAMGSGADVQAAAHLPHGLDGGASLTLVRLEGFGPSIAARTAIVQALWRDVGGAEVLDEATAAAAWDALRTLATLPADWPLWRINTPPSGGAKVAQALEPLGAQWLFDWAGGLTWLSFVGDADVVRQAAKAAGGHAMLVRAVAGARAQVPALHPPQPGVAALEARVRASFDPAGVFETGRFLDGCRDPPHAN